MMLQKVTDARMHNHWTTVLTAMSSSMQAGLTIIQYAKKRPCKKKFQINKMSHKSNDYIDKDVNSNNNISNKVNKKTLLTIMLLITTILLIITLN